MKLTYAQVYTVNKKDWSREEKMEPAETLSNQKILSSYCFLRITESSFSQWFFDPNGGGAEHDFTVSLLEQILL